MEPGCCCRFTTIFLIFLKILMAVTLILVVVWLRDLVTEAVEQVVVSCETSELKSSSECAKFRDMSIWGIIRTVFLIVIIVVSVMIAIDLIGCCGSVMANRCAICFFIVMTVIFMIILLAPTALSIIAAVALDKTQNGALNTVREMLNNTMATLESHLNSVRNNSIYSNNSIELTKEQAELLKNIMGQNTSAYGLDKEIHDKTVQLKKKAVEVSSNVATKIIAVQKTIDWIQEKFECCGITGYKNWGTFSMRNILPNVKELHYLLVGMKDKNGKELRTWEQECFYSKSGSYVCFVPESCCKKRGDQCNKINEMGNDVADVDKIYTESCTDSFMDHVFTTVKILAILLGSTFGLIILIIITSCCARNKIQPKPKGMEKPMPKGKVQPKPKETPKAAPPTPEKSASASGSTITADSV